MRRGWANIYSISAISKRYEQAFSAMKLIKNETESQLNDQNLNSNKLFSAARHVGRSKPGSKPVQLYVRFSLRPLGQLLYGCTTWTLTKRLEKTLDGNYTRILRAILNKSWWKHPAKHQLYGHLPPITKTLQVRRTKHVGHCWRSRDELISDVLLWTPTYGRAKAGRPARTYI